MSVIAVFITFLILCGCTLGINVISLWKRYKKPRLQQILLETENMILEETETNLPAFEDNGSPTLTDTYAIVDNDDAKKHKFSSNIYITQYETMNKYFVETARYLHGEETFFKKGVVIFSGPPGCGKTMAAVHLILKLLEQDRHLTFRKISKSEEMLYIKKDKMSLVFIDNIFLRGTMNSDFEPWWDMLTHIHSKYLTSRENECGSNRLRMIMTTGTNDIEKACDFMRKSIPILEEKLSINLNCFKGNEKDAIFLKQAEFAKKENNINLHDVDDKFIRKIRKSEGPIGFPLCANLYVCGEKYRENGSIFFSHPIEYLKRQIKDEIEKDKKNQIKSLFFFIFFYERQKKGGILEEIDIKDGDICRRFLKRIFSRLDEMFGPFAFKDMERKAQQFGEFFKTNHSGHQYTFVHDSVYEAVGAYFCEQSIERTAKYFPLDIIQNQDFGILTEQQKATLTSRLLDESRGHKFRNVFACKVFQDPQFAKYFCSQLEKQNKKTIKSFFTLENKESAGNLPAIFWSSCYNLTFLTECFYDIITQITSDTDKHLFVSLYGLCCSKNKGSWKLIERTFCEQFDGIKEHVLAFGDDKGNSILHLVITSDFTDQFVATAVEKVIENNQPSVDYKNKFKVTPIMAAVEQPIRREKVIKALIKLSAKLRYKDKNYSTVFHHCLGSCNDDETCAEYLKLLLNQEHQDTGKLLCKEDVNENTALSIAAKESKRSRIQSMLILLESNANIVDTLNEDGYSQLHLCVTSLSGDPTSVELECCARVITLVLYGANPEIKSDKNDKATDQCRYKSVKNILQNHKDQMIMENEMDTLLNKINWQQLYGDFDAKCINSVKITSAMRERLAKAVKCLNKIKFD